jgi:hypothetical protein
VLVAFDDVELLLRSEVANGALEQGGLARAGRAHDVERKDIASLGEAAYALGKRVVSPEYVLLDADALLVAVFVVMMVVVMRMRVRGAVGMVMMMVVVRGLGIASAGRTHLLIIN